MQPGFSKQFCNKDKGRPSTGCKYNKYGKIGKNFVNNAKMFANMNRKYRKSSKFNKTANDKVIRQKGGPKQVSTGRKQPKLQRFCLQRPKCPLTRVANIAENKRRGDKE